LGLHPFGAALDLCHVSFDKHSAILLYSSSFVNDLELVHARGVGAITDRSRFLAGISSGDFSISDLLLNNRGATPFTVGECQQIKNVPLGPRAALSIDCRDQSANSLSIALLARVSGVI